MQTQQNGFDLVMPTIVGVILGVMTVVLFLGTNVPVPYRLFGGFETGLLGFLVGLFVFNG